MVRKLIFIGAIFAMLSWKVYGQEVKTDTIRVNQVNTLAEELGDSIGVVTTGLTGSSNWFISASVGVNGFAAEANREYNSFINRMKPMGQISVGKWLTPVWGLRFQIGAGRLGAYYHPFNFYNLYDRLPDHTVMPDGISAYLSEKDGRTWFNRKFTYMDWQLDVMTDVVRWFTKEEKRVGFYLFMGPGFSHAFGSQQLSANNSFALKAGGQLDLKLTDKLSLIVELQGTIVDESLDGQIGGLSSTKNRTLEGYAGLSLGLTYKFGGKKFKRFVKVNPVTVENVYHRQPAKVVEIPAPVEDILTVFTVRFLIDQSNIEEDQMINIRQVAEYLQEHPQAELQLSGYADRETAYPAYNMKLSERRVNRVKDCLVKDFHIQPERLHTSAKGDIERAYEEDYRWNRAVVMEIIDQKTENK